MLFKIINKSLRLRRCVYLRYMTSRETPNIDILCKHLDVSEDKAEYMQLKQPYLTKISKEAMINMIDTMYVIGYTKDDLVKHPNLFAMLPITLKNRFRVLEECGFQDITPDLLISYLTVLKQKTIEDLRNAGLISPFINIENKLASLMSQWPTSLTTLVQGDVNKFTLYDLRIRIIQRYLELMIDLSKEAFFRGIQTYPTIKHRPLKAINETLIILQSQIGVPVHRIRSNLYLIHADPDNLQKIIYNVRTLGGIDVKEVIRLYPKIATKNYSTLIEIKDVFEKHGITPEAQAKCLLIFTLSPETISERLEHAKTTPEFSLYVKHPRFLKMIYHNKTALKRLTNLQSINKKCLSLNILSGSNARYETFEKAPGDRLGKGKDLLFSISQLLGKNYTTSQLRHTLKRHPFWINIPLIEVKYVSDKLMKKFSIQDIFENCAILLYPWHKIEETLSVIEKKKYINGIDLKNISDKQKLSLVLYFLEKNHYFTGNGVWTENQKKSLASLSETTQLKQGSETET